MPNLKKFSLIFIGVLFASGLLLAINASADSVSTPSVPSFTLKMVDKSYNVPPETTSITDPYNGNVTTSTVPGYYVTKYEIELKIQNIYCPPNVNGHSSELYYNVRHKGAYGTQWTESSEPIKADNGQYTVIYFDAPYRVDDKVDFQVEALIGYHYETWMPNHPLAGTYSAFESQSSGWSPSRTFTMPDTSVLFATPAPSVPEFNAPTIIVALIVGGLAIAVVIKKKQPSNPQSRN
ncbi:MAG: hypothetical protein ACFCUE_10295 [Candidatus Bathyarchaeia archaeon]